jgi:hypothetical protein
MQQGLSQCRTQETQQAQQQARSLYGRKNAHPNPNHHCIMSLEPFVFPRRRCYEIIGTNA